LVSAIINQQIPPAIAARITKSTERRKKAKEKSAKRLESRQTAKGADANTPAGRVINVIHNEAKSGIEIQYDAEPSSEDITTLKDKGFRFSFRQKLWYCTYTHDTWAWAQSLMPSHQTSPPQDSATQAEPQPAATSTTPPVASPSTSLPVIDIAALLGRK
jgi:hypothetical protein